MTFLMVLMLLCFLIVGLRGLVEWQAIMSGFVPSIPPDLPLPDGGGARVATTSIIAMVGAAIAPAALLGLPGYADPLAAFDVAEDLSRFVFAPQPVFESAAADVYAS